MSKKKKSKESPIESVCGQARDINVSALVGSPVSEDGVVGVRLGDLSPSPEDPVYKAFVDDQIILDTTVTPSDAVQEAQTQVPVDQKPNVPVEPVVSLFQRDYNGLLIGKDYIRENGKINWQAMFNPKYFVFPKDDHTKDPMLKADGLRDLADIRGYTSKEVTVQVVSSEFIIVKVKMCFIPNLEEPNGKIVEACADATFYNVGDEAFKKYLTTIAETRATSRCIKEALGIRLCSYEEISKDDLPEDEINKNPITSETLVAIERQMEVKGISNEDVMKFINEKYPNITSFNQLNITQGQETLKFLAAKTNNSK